MSTERRKVSKVLILAGARRDGDPLVAACNVAHKAVIDINGRAMISRVVEALSGAGLGDRIVIAASGATQKLIKQALGPAVSVDFIEPAQSPSATLLAATHAYANEAGILATTCDHALLTPAMINDFLDGIEDGADIAAAIVEEAVFRAEFPQARRTFIKLQDGAFSGANLFWINPQKAAPLFEFWRSLEENRKHPLKMARAIGVTTAVAYFTRRLDRAGLVRTIARKTGVKGQLAPLNHARAAIDVDKIVDVELVRKLMMDDVASRPIA